MFLPKAFPDELLFSRIIRHLILSGLKVTQIQGKIFVNSRVCAHPTLTQYHRRLSEHSSESPNSFYRQTLGPLYQMCLPASYQSMEERMLDGELHHISRLWQMPNSRGQQIHSLQYCAQCAFNDMKRWGVPYWRRTHQMPNIIACPFHGTVLHSQKLPSRYHLSVEMPPINNQSLRASPEDLGFARFCSRLITHAMYENKEALLNSIFVQLEALGYLTDKKRIRRKSLCLSLFNKVGNLRPSNPYWFPENEFDYAFLSNVLSQEHFCHPGRMCVFLYWLSFCENNDGLSQPRTASSVSCKTEKEKQCYSLLNSGTSLNETAKIIDKSRTYVKSIALKYGQTSRLAPKRINVNVRNSIANMASKGWNRNAIAKHFGVSTGSVEMVISSITGLVDRRRQIKFESMRRRYRVTILRFLASRPDAIRKTVFAENSAAAYWLYQNDYAWLMAKLPKAQPAQFLR
jgi:hypothetical protein